MTCSAASALNVDSHPKSRQRGEGSEETGNRGIARERTVNLNLANDGKCR